jgi:hypothetical protein
MNRKIYPLKWALVYAIPEETRATGPHLLRSPECECCERGATSTTPNGTRAPPRPLLPVRVKHRQQTPQGADELIIHLLCFACAMNQLGVHSDVITQARVAYRKSYNEQHFAHLVAPARLAASMGLAPPQVKRFLECVNHGEEVPPKVLRAVVAWNG